MEKEKTKRKFTIQSDVQTANIYIFLSVTTIIHLQD